MNGTLPSILTNEDSLYEGTLIQYFKVIFNTSTNLRAPYHNFRHMLHVLYLCYQACIFYKDTLTPREMRSLLIAALFHDFNHCGVMGDDDLNISRAIRGFEKNMLKEDVESSSSIIDTIRATQFPYVTPSEELTLSGQIIRDADKGQPFSIAWIQQTVIGLSSEWDMKPIEILRGQPVYLEQLSFCTLWGQSIFTAEVIEDKIKETRAILGILEDTLPVG